MKLDVLKFIKNLFLFTISIGIVQYLITEYVFSHQVFYYNTIVIYGFLFFLTLFLYTAILYIKKLFSEYIGYAFMAGSIFKMVFSILFLLPIIMKGDRSYITDVIAFFIPYFLYLFFETVFVVKLFQAEKY